jgi:hypothetical protein
MMDQGSRRRGETHNLHIPTLPLQKSTQRKCITNLRFGKPHTKSKIGRYEQTGPNP